jgi:chromosome segregation ATPase
LAIIEKLNRTLDELIKYKGVLIATIENANDRMDNIEKKMAQPKPAELSEELQVQIDNLEKAVEGISKGFIDYSKESSQIEIRLNESEKNMAQISEKASEAIKLAQDDNKFLGGAYTELKDHIKDTDTKFRDSGKEIAKVNKELGDEKRLKTLLKELAKELMA